jgi:uncharacterized protein (TIGR02145 family)
MNKHIILRLINIVTLVSIILVLVTCKKDGTTDPESTVPTAVTTSAAWVGQKWAIMKGQVNGMNKLTKVTFEYDTASAYTNLKIVSPVPDTTSINKTIIFSLLLTDLTPNTTYYYRIRAISPGGTAVGSSVAFITTDTTEIVINFNPDLTYDSIYDSEGNKYKTIQIGTQTWMAENMKSASLNDGTDIPFILDATAWSGLSTPGYCWFNGDSVGYGAIYNWYTVETGKICPEGWHVPSDNEWTTLTDYLGGISVSGGKLKESGTSHWMTPNTGATNESGFTGLPTGYRSNSGLYSSIGGYGYWWSSTEASTTEAYYRDSYYRYNSVDRSSTNKKSGATIRCIKD